VIGRVPDAVENPRIEAVPKAARQHVDRHDLRLRRDADGPVRVVGRGDDAGDVGAMVEVEARIRLPVFDGAVAVLRKRRAQVGADVRGEVRAMERLAVRAAISAVATTSRLKGTSVRWFARANANPF
jgi:hypothetical protein